MSSQSISADKQKLNLSGAELEQDVVEVGIQHGSLQ